MFVRLFVCVCVCVLVCYVSELFSGGVFMLKCMWVFYINTFCQANYIMYCYLVFC